MAFQTLSGALSGTTQSYGLRGFPSGQPLSSASANGDLQDIQSPSIYSIPSGVLMGGVCTASALTITIPAGTAYFAGQVWITNSVYTQSVPDASTTYIWGCSDGIIRITSSNTPPVGFTAASACIICAAVSSGGIAVIQSNSQQSSSYFNPTSRIISPVGKPLTIYGYQSGKPGAGQVIFRYPVNRSLSIPTNAVNSHAIAGISPTASAQFIINKNGASIGSFTYAIGATIATWIMGAAVIFNPGDILSITAPAAQDTTLSDVAFNIEGIYI